MDSELLLKARSIGVDRWSWSSEREYRECLVEWCHNPDQEYLINTDNATVNRYVDGRVKFILKRAVEEIESGG